MCRFTKINSLLFICLIITLFNLSTSMAGMITIDFETLNHMQDVTTYLSGFGISVSAEPGTTLVALDETQVYGGAVVDAPSGTNYVIQLDTSTNNQAYPPSFYTLDFSTPLDSFGFSESAILVPSITASWTATAYDGPGATGTILDTASFTGSSLHSTLVFTLSGPGIQSVHLNQTASSYAAFWVANLDDFVLTGPGVGVAVIPAPGAFLLGSIGVGLVGWLRRGRAL